MTTERDPLKHYAQVCLRAGLPIRTMTEMDVYLAAGHIIGNLSRQQIETGLSTQELLEAMDASQLHYLRLAIEWQESVEGPKATSWYRS